MEAGPAPKYMVQNLIKTMKNVQHNFTITVNNKFKGRTNHLHSFSGKLLLTFDSTVIFGLGTRDHISLTLPTFQVKIKVTLRLTVG
jgi:hypothetical protein